MPTSNYIDDQETPSYLDRMAPKSGKQKGFKRADYPEQKDERRQLILRAAAEEFSLVASVDDLTIDAVARRSGLAKGTVYLYFKSKGAILIELWGDAIEGLATDISDKFAKLSDPLNAAEAAAILRDCLRKSAVKRRLAQLAKSLPDKSLPAPRQDYMKRLEPCLEQADADIVRRLGKLRPGDGRKIIRYGWALLLGLSEIIEHLPRSTNVPLHLEESLTESLTLLIEGLLKRATSPAPSTKGYPTGI